MMVPNFLYNSSFHFPKIIIIITIIIMILILIYYYHHSYFLTAHSNCVRVLLVENHNILLV